MNIKKSKILKLAFLTMATTLMLGAASQISYAQESILKTNIQASSNIIEIEELIFSEDFENGLPGWIISNPQTNNPRVEVDSQGNHYLRAGYGERASKMICFPPNSRIRIYAEVAGIPDAVIKVFQLNPGEHETVIHEARFSSRQMTKIDTEFNTPNNTTNFYLSLESHGAPGESWANFDNIRVYEVIEIVEDNLLLNGDFSEGLNHWVGEAEIVSQNGNNHAIVRNGAPISQSVRLQPRQYYTLTFNALTGSNLSTGAVLVIGLPANNSWSFEVLAYEEISSQRNLDNKFNTLDFEGAMVLVIPYLNSEYVVTNFRLVEAR